MKCLRRIFALAADGGLIVTQAHDNFGNSLHRSCQALQICIRVQKKYTAYIILLSSAPRKCATNQRPEPGRPAL